MKVLAVCYYAPPQLTPQAIQIGRQLYHMDAEVTLLHSREPGMSTAYDQYPDFFQRVRALEVPDPGGYLSGLPLRLWRRMWKLHGRLPDNLGRWRGRAVQAALAEVLRNRPDVIASFGVPMSDHLVALQVKRATGLPWLAHFSDPWTDNPFHAHHPLASRINGALERQVIEHADAVLFTSRRTRELVMRKYPDSWLDKAAVLPHAWDMDNFAGPGPQPKASGARHVIRHIGAFYEVRSPEPLFQALARIHAATPQLLDGIRFELVGPIQQKLLDSDALRALPPGLLDIAGTVGYRESLALARSASALLVIDAPSATPSVFLPSKLVEYIGANRPVWGITPPGTSAELIAEWAHGAPATAAPDDLDGIVRMLSDALARLDQQGGGPDEVRQRFAPQRVAAGLAAHLQDAIARRAAAGLSMAPRTV